MPHVTGENRNQFIMISLEEMVSKDSFVRVIDVFVDSIDLESFGFAHVKCKEEGRPAFHPSVLMKLYLYGYRYGIRTSRKLEREASMNIEAMWLTSCQCPKYKTIADFRKNHSKAFRLVFRSFVKLLKDWDLVDGKTIAVDSFKIRAQNSLKNNLNKAKIDRHLEYIDDKISEYEEMLNQSDNEEDKQELENKIEKQNTRKENYKEILSKLDNSEQDQISLTDPDSRAVILHRNIVNVGYNIQAASDSKNKLLVAYQTGDVNDTHALSDISIETKEVLQCDKMDVIADKGYHTGEELKKCEMADITTYVSPKASSAKDIGLFPVSVFVYNREKDFYTCPADEILTTNNVWYKHSSRNKKGGYNFRRYTTTKCKACHMRNQCTSGDRNGRVIDRNEYADSIEENKKRVENNPEYYKQRQQITEHQFGTLKRQRGFTYTIMKGKEKVLGEVGLAFITYNLTRCISVFGVPELCKALKEACRLYFSSRIELVLGNFKRFFKKMETSQIKQVHYFAPSNHFFFKNKRYICMNNYLKTSFCTDSRYALL